MDNQKLYDTLSSRLTGNVDVSLDNKVYITSYPMIISLEISGDLLHGSVSLTKRNGSLGQVSSILIDLADVKGDVVDLISKQLYKFKITSKACFTCLERLNFHESTTNRTDKDQSRSSTSVASE